jgi:hypothetical protein
LGAYHAGTGFIMPQRKIWLYTRSRAIALRRDLE